MMKAWIGWGISVASLRSKTFARTASIAGDVASLAGWAHEEFGPGVRSFRKRQQLWDVALQHLTSQQVTGIEFGVAQGNGTKWWLDRVDNPRLVWHGFDRFTGLPHGWRGLKAGHFDNGGKPPEIVDPRVRWHIGDVEETILSLEIDRADDEQWIVLFDLDLFAPSLAAWEGVRDHIRSGDILYFDEALDRDERHLLIHSVLPTRKFECIGITPLSIALQVAG